MLTVKPIQSKEEQKKLCLICGIEFRCESFAYRADVDDEFIGICQFSFHDGIGCIENLTYANGKDDTEAMIIMLRTAMNFMFRCGIFESCFLKESSSDILYKHSGYTKKSNGEYYINLKSFFSSPCRYLQK